MREFENFTDCYLSLIHEVFNRNEYESSPRGQKIREKLGVSFRIKDPRNRYPFIAGRNFSPTYYAAEMLWYLTGNSSTEWIAKYSKFWLKISDDGKTANSAYGARIFHPSDVIAQGRFTQWEFVKDELRKDPDSRRAIIHLRVPDDSIDAKLDVPCTLSLQFLIRENKLHMIVNMRSSDLIFGIAYDVPAFTFFQEMLAIELDVDIGTYTHMSNSLHIYERHFPMVRNILTDGNTEKSLTASCRYGPMRSFDPANFLEGAKEYWLEKISIFEREITSYTDGTDVCRAVSSFCGIRKKNVWTDLANLLAIHKLKKLNRDDLGLGFRDFSYRGYNFDLERRNEI